MLAAKMTSCVVEHFNVNTVESLLHLLNTHFRTASGVLITMLLPSGHTYYELNPFYTADESFWVAFARTLVYNNYLLSGGGYTALSKALGGTLQL